MTLGRMSNTAKHTVVPKDDFHHTDGPNGEVVCYQMSQEELAKYRAIPNTGEKWSVFKIPMRGKKI